MNEIIQKLGKEAGFDFDPTDSNFYGREGWCNQEISRLVEFTVLEVCKHVNAYIQHSSNPHDCLLVLDIKDKFGIPLNPIN